jgi:hypothetical protein
MGWMEKSLGELNGMLKTAKADMQKGVSHILAVSEGSWKVKKDKNKRKDKEKALVMTVSTQKVKATTDAECFYYKGERHWKRNCPKYLEHKKNGNARLPQVFLSLKFT